MSPSHSPAKRTIRSPEQRAADYQAKANKARAKAAQIARDRETRAKILLANGLIKAVTEGQQLYYRASGDTPARYNLVFIKDIMGDRLTSEEWQMIEDWWKTKGYPER